MGEWKVHPVMEQSKSEQAQADNNPYWYALKVFYSKARQVQEDFRKFGYDTYLPIMIEEHFEAGELRYVEKPLVASLLFVHCPENYLLEYKRTHDTHMLYYADLITKRPGRIPDREMDIFRIATSVAGTDPDALYLGSDTDRLCTGDRVRVTDGIYKGAEGYIKRIRHARKVLVAIKGVAVVALSNIHPQYLEKI